MIRNDYLSDRGVRSFYNASASHPTHSYCIANAWLMHNYPRHSAYLMCVKSLSSSCLEVPNPRDLKNLLPFFPFEGSALPAPAPLPAAAASLSRPVSIGTEAEANCAALQAGQNKTKQHNTTLTHNYTWWCFYLLSSKDDRLTRQGKTSQDIRQDEARHHHYRT